MADPALVDAVAGTIRERNLITELFRRNAAMKHGVPIKPEMIQCTKTVEKEVPIEVPVEKVVEKVVPGPTVTHTVTTSPGGTNDPPVTTLPVEPIFNWKKVLLYYLPWIALLVAGSILFYSWITSGEPAADQIYSPFQYIQDEGDHLP
jgi:hypothetical protein